MSFRLRANNSQPILTVLISVLTAGSVFAGPDVYIDNVDPKQVNLEKEGPTVEVVTARESRGLITLEGPSGMFIDPTSATLPRNTFVLNYCVFVPTIPEGVSLVGHGILLSYGVLDWLEVGFTGDLLDLSVDQHTVTTTTRQGVTRTTIAPATEDTYVVGGPEVRIRLLRDRVDKWWPEVSIGTYFHLGTPDVTPLSTDNGYKAFLALSKTVPICEHGFLKTITFQGGFRTQFLTTDLVHEKTSERGYGGIEVQLPWNLYAIGEIVTRDDELDNTLASGKNRFPWAAGLQWRGRYFGCTIAALQNGIEDSPGIYFGVGGGLGAEPVRTTTGTGGVPGATR
jgi:hypothetical protein